MSRGKLNYRRPLYEAGAVYGTRGSLRRRSSTWVWGCGFLAGLSCIGMVLVAMIAIPITFRLLPADLQSRISGRLPFMRVFIPTREVAQLPTLDPARATAAAASFSTPTPGGSRLATATPTMLPTATYAPLPATFRVENARWIAQKWNNCGPANLAQVLNIMGDSVKQETAAAWLKPDINDANVSPWQIAAYTNQFTQLRSLVRYNGEIALLKQLIYNGFGVLIETGLYDHDDGQWLGHYLTVIGWDDAGGYLLGLDTLTNSEDARGIHEEYTDLDSRWQHFNRTYVVVYRPDQESRLREIMGLAWDAKVNIQLALGKALDETARQQDNPFAWFNVGTNYTMLGEYAQAAAAFDRARSVGGGWPWRMLWYQFAPYVAYYKTGAYDVVISLANTTAIQTRYVEETNYYRALAYAATGANTQAISELQSAISFNPNFEPAKQALNQLRNGQQPTLEFM
ncbi:MAG: C39 family peptidase [Anaerolineae bacterium]|nr:C39 family peptidase [Anaerolineae bacterium]